MILLAPFAAVSALLLAAGALKLRSPRPAARALARSGLPGGARAVRVLAVCEVLAGAACLAVPTRAGAALIAAAFAAFAAFLAWPGRGGGCGCFGADEDRAPARLEVGLDACCAAVAVAAAVTPPRGLPSVVADDPALGFVLAVGVLGAAFAAYLAFTALPAAWRAYGSGT